MYRVLYRQQCLYGMVPCSTWSDFHTETVHILNTTYIYMYICMYLYTPSCYRLYSLSATYILHTLHIIHTIHIYVYKYIYNYYRPLGETAPRKLLRDQLRVAGCSVLKPYLALGT